MLIQKHSFAIVSSILAMFCVYVLFPFQTSTLDGFSYAVCVQHGEQLFAPHHLFYTSSNCLFYNILKAFGLQVEVMAMMKFVNALSAVAALSILALILEKFNPKATSNISWIVLAGISFGTLRFATDVETYIMPTISSLLGSYILILNKEKLTHSAIVLASFFAAFACLFHQIHFFWWLSLGFYVWLTQKSTKSLLFYFLPALIVPLTYLAVLVWYNHSSFSLATFFQFVFHDYLNGQADVAVGLKGVLLSGINFGRTFYQVHGYMGGLFHIYPTLCIILFLFTLILLFFAIRAAFTIKVHSQQVAFRNAHLMLLVMQFVFAALSDGNAEFMAVMLFQIPIVVALSFKDYEKMLAYFASSVLVWNIGMAAIPMHYIDMTGDKPLVDFMYNNKQALFILNNRPKADNMLRYYYNEVLNVEKVVTNVSNDSIHQAVTQRIDSFLDAKLPVYTDALDSSAAFSRETMLADVDKSFFASWNAIASDTLRFGMGNRVLTRLEYKIK